MAETPLEQCRRHVAEGVDRIARQEDLIARMVISKQEHLMAKAVALLRSLEDVQRLSEEHLAREIIKDRASRA